jgi:hypothetical protein
MDLDDVMEAQDFDRATLGTVAERLRGSRTLEQFIYREAELDEVWRLLDTAVLHAGSLEERMRLTQLREAVVEAHDLVGAEHNPQAAANRLSEAVLAGLAK